MFNPDTLAVVPALTITLVISAMLLAGSGANRRREKSGSLIAVLAGSLLIYAAGNLLVLLAGWILSAWPVMRTTRTGALHKRASVALGASCVLLAGAALLLGTSPLEEPGVLSNSAAWWTFGLATLAALIRSGIFPFHLWVVAIFDDVDEMMPSAALLSVQSGAFLVARLAPALPEQAGAALPVVSDLALFSALLMAFFTLGEKRPRRTLALVAASQSAFLIAGLEIRNVEGITGALVHALVVAACIGGLATVYRIIYARCGDVVDERFAGLGIYAPRLSVFFLVFALALVGLPGTLGFAAEDLLFHGALETHPALGIALPMATALTAISLLRLHSYMFLGRRRLYVAPIRDARVGERIACTVLLVLLVVFGLMPGAIVESRIAPAKQITGALGGPLYQSVVRDPQR